MENKKRKIHPIKAWLYETDLTLMDLSREAGISKNYLSKIVNGHVPISRSLGMKLQTVTLIPWERLVVLEPEDYKRPNA